MHNQNINTLCIIKIYGNRKKQKVVVFGATGNLGAYIAMKLYFVGYDVIAVGGRSSDNGFFAAHGMSYYSVNIKDYSSFSILDDIGDVYAVCHFAGSLPSRYAYDPQDLVESITVGTLNVLRFMQVHNAKKIIFPQTPYDLAPYFGQFKNGGKLGADLRRGCPLTGDHAVYTIAKNAAADLIEHYHATYGISRFILRFFTIYQYHPNPWHFADYKRRMMPFRMLMDRAMRSLPIEIWGDCSKRKEMVYVKDFAQLVANCVASPLEGGTYNVGNGWQVSLEEQIKGIVEVFSPKDNPSVITYVKDKPDPLENAFDATKTFNELNWKPQYSYLDQLRDFKHEMETEPFAQLWGTKADYAEQRCGALGL